MVNGDKAKTVRPGICRLASARRLQEAKPLSDDLFGVLVTLPLILELQPCPLIGIEGLQGGPSELAVRRGLRREKGWIRPADRGFLRFRAGRRRLGLGRFGGRTGRAGGERSKHRQRDREAVRDPRFDRKTFWHRLVWPLVTSAHGSRMLPWRLGRRPSGAIMADKVESNFKN